MDPIHLYDYLVRAREELFNAIRPLPAAAYTQAFPFGLGSISRTLPHMLNAEWVYTYRIRALATPPRSEAPVSDDNPPLFPELEAAWRAQAERTRAVLAGIRDWSKSYEYQRDWDGVQMLITGTPAEFFAQLFTHEIHHRAQVMSMLRQLGAPAQDLDYSILMIKRRPV